ncbi:glycosyltransferase family 8 protein, partial [Cetobacterium sp.]|uniref:glycosyltransferase family 8 protein n=1 Tax=Cetobacterium sp. TaxID=2071632 RepID=UPI003F38D280
RLNLSLDRTYFNAGVMVMDLKKLRENSKFLKTIDYCLNPDRELQLNEQDALNIIFENDYMTNNIVWNYTHGNSEENSCTENEIGIIHFTGDIKPWDCRSYSPYKYLYWKYLNETPWKGFEEENKTLKNILKRELVKFKLKTRKIRYALKGKK